MGLRRRKIGIILVALVVLATGAWLLFHPREPTYDGKPLTYWLKAYNDLPYPRVWKSDYAIQHIGTNAIPFLLRELQVKDSAIKKWFLDRAWEHYLRLNLKAGDLAYANVRNERASEAFRALGPDAKPAIPALIRIYQQNPSEDSRHRILDTLGRIGPAADDAVPFLLRELNANTNDSDKAYIEGSICRIHGRPDLVLPIASSMATNDNRNIYGFGLLIIMAYGTNAHSTIPALLQIMADETPQLRGRQSWVTQILGRLKAEPSVVVPALTRTLYTTNDSRGTSASLLAGYGAEASSAIPALLRILDDNDPTVRTAAASAILQISPHDPSATEPALAWLRSQLDGTNIVSRVDAAIALFRANPKDNHAFDVVVACMKTQSPPRGF